MTGRSFVQIDRPAGFDSGTRIPSTSRVDLWFFGSIQAPQGSVDVYVNVRDLSFVVPPKIYLPERPTWLQGWRPHLLREGANLPEDLCYSDHEKYQLLAHNPAAAIQRVFADAIETLKRIARPESAKEDSQREIAQLWRHGAVYEWVLIDIEPRNSDHACLATMVTSDKFSALLISDDARKLASKLGITGKFGPPQHAIIYPEPPAPLYLTATGAPTNTRQMKEWLEEVSPETFKRWHARLLAVETYRQEILLHLFRTRGQVIGYLMAEKRGMRKVHSARQIKDFLRDHIYGNSIPIARISAFRFDEDYLIRRNLRVGCPDLRGIKILLIGCGAIGGYLAQSLVQLGAGNALGSTAGALSLCDNDLLAGSNFGRHLLGFPYLGQPKTSALQKHLESFRPTATVTSENCLFYDIEGRLDEFDLIIDAAGYESLSRHISKLVRSTKWLRRGRALLSVWIEGQGGVTRCLLQDDVRAACYDCMWNYNSNTAPTQRHQAYSDPQWIAMSEDGYATMTPYAVSAPQAATALAIDTLLDWRAGKESLRFRSRSTEGPGINPSFAKDLARGKACPGCST